MLETKWQIDDDAGKGWSYEKTGNLFIGKKTNSLEQKLTDLISGNNKIYNGQIYEATLRSGFLPTHAVDIFTSLQSRGKLSTFSDKEEKVRRGAFYINYENYKTFPKRVYFKIK